MKGISPVIATVLLLLMAVASVGGAWIWYQRQSTALGGKTEEKIGEQVEQQTGVALSLASIYTRSDGNITLIVNNAGGSSVNITGFKLRVGSTDNVNTSANIAVGSKTTAKVPTLISCTTGDTVKVQLYAAGISTQVYEEKC
jgi:flagellin-like protein